MDLEEEGKTSQSVNIELVDMEANTQASKSKGGIKEHHPSLSGTAGWLRAGVLGANDAIVSVSALMVGVAANPNSTTSTILMSGLAGLIAGAMSMAVGEYVSVSSQKDLEDADLALEKRELELHPEEELQELAAIYEQRGVEPETAMAVAIQLTNKNALEAHAKDELGIVDFSAAQPFQAAFVSLFCFLGMGSIPFVTAIIGSAISSLRWVVIVAICLVALLLLAISGALGAWFGGSNYIKGALRVTVGGALALGITMAVGYLSQYVLTILGSFSP